jgi:signal transduction histidine kinase
VAILATAALSWLAYGEVRSALTTEFERRLESLAATVASQLGVEDIEDVHLYGEDGSGYLHLQVQLEELRSTVGAANASVVDSARATLYDARLPEVQREPSALDTLARDALARALAGTPVVTDAYARYGATVRAGLAPVTDGERVAAVVAIELEPPYGPVLEGFARRLLSISLVLAAAIAILGVVRIRLERRAARLEARLSRAENLAVMGRLTATLAHEIKNPLAIIRGSAERLGKLEPEAARMATFVVEESDRLSRTVGRYLQFARGDEAAAGRGDAAETLTATLELLEGECRARRIEVVREGAIPEHAPVALDNESLKQVWLNLVLNSVEAMPEGGSLRVRTAESSDGLEVRFSDTGPGIPPELLERLGSPFLTTKAQGSGLGLFLARRLVRNAGGSLTLRNGTSGGAECTVRLPHTKDG